MKIPKTLRLQGVRWKVRIEDLPPDTRGETDLDGRVIRLAKGLDKHDLVVTFAHELIHACLGPEVDLYLPRGKDELLVTLLAPRLVEVLKQIGKWK